MLAAVQVLGKTGYMAVGLLAAMPCVLLPAFLQPKSELGKPWHRQYWVKANVWIAIFSFVGNYFWTHYFYHLLGASYTFPSWRLNGVSILSPSQPIQKELSKTLTEEHVTKSSAIPSCKPQYSFLIASIISSLKKFFSVTCKAFVSALLVFRAAFLAEEVVIFAGSDHPVLHDTCLLLLLPCPVKCLHPACRACSCISWPMGCSRNYFCGRLFVGICNSICGDTDHRTLPILCLQGRTFGQLLSLISNKFYWTSLMTCNGRE